MGHVELRCKVKPTDENVMLFKRILVVESDQGAASQICDILDLHFYEVTVVASGADAMRALLRQTFDAIICDFTMPHFPAEMFHLAVQRVRPALCRRLIAISNSAQTTRAARNVGTISIWKPIEPQILLEAVESVLKKAEKPAREPSYKAA